MTDLTRVFPGILPLLQTLRDCGIQTAVVSNKLHAGVTGLCKDYFGDLLSCAFGVQEESERKPNPVNVFRALEHLGVEKDRAVYVGDSEVDAQTAKHAGLRCIGVTWGYRDKATLLQAGVSALIDAPQQLPALL